MNKNVIVLLEILENEHVYSLKKLQLKLSQYNLNLTEQEIISLIVQTLYESICYLKMNKKNNEKCMYKCFKYLNAGNNIKYLEKIEIIQILTKTIEKINKRIEHTQTNLNSIVRQNISFLLKIKDNIELTIIQAGIKTTNSDNNGIDDDRDRIENTLYYFIFKQQKYNYVYEIFKTFPELANFKTHCGKYILDDVITEYLKCLNSPNNFEELYYEKIIDLFLKSDKLKFTKGYKDTIINRLLLVKDNLKQNDFSKRKNKRIRFFLNDVIQKIKQFEIIDQEQLLSHINYRYGIQDTYNSNYYDKFAKQKYISKDDITLDLSNRYTFTVDNENTNSFDDAFSLIKNSDGNYELDVYISDLSHYIEPNTKLDELALKKGATIYLPDYTLTMLPHSLTYTNCSLVKNNYRNVIAHRFIFSKSFDIISFDIRRAIIKINDNFSYNDIKNIFEGTDIFKIKTLSTIVDIANSIKRNNFYNMDYHYIKTLKRQYLTPNAKLLEKYQNSHTNFVDVLMILTNYFTSDLFLRLNFPFIYRVNTSNVDLSLVDHIKELKENEFSMQIVDCLKYLYNPSYYSEYNLGHNGLNLSSYGHVTVPIRNYASLFSQRLECKYLIDNKIISEQQIYDDEEKIKEVVNYVNDRIFYNDEYCAEYRQKIKQLK